MIRTLVVGLAIASMTGCAMVQASGGPRYRKVNLAATEARFGAPIVNPALANAWGIAIRPAGFGGHFWITGQGSGESVEYVGDVAQRPLSQDALKLVAIPGPGGTTGTPTGVVFNAGSSFVITQAHPSGAITAPAKFIFATDTGTLSAWTERKRADGRFDWPRRADLEVDLSAEGAQFFGLGISASGRRLYAADFGAAPRLRVFDRSFRERTPSPRRCSGPAITPPSTSNRSGPAASCL